jgi:hypothetical protein
MNPFPSLRIHPIVVALDALKATPVACSLTVDLSVLLSSNILMCI